MIPTTERFLQVYDPYEQPPTYSGSVMSLDSIVISYATRVTLRTRRIVGQQWRAAWFRLKDVRTTELNLIHSVISAENNESQ